MPKNKNNFITGSRRLSEKNAGTRAIRYGRYSII